MIINQRMSRSCELNREFPWILLINIISGWSEINSKNSWDVGPLIFQIIFAAYIHIFIKNPHFGPHLGPYLGVKKQSSNHKLHWSRYYPYQVLMLKTFFLQKITVNSPSSVHSAPEEPKSTRCLLIGKVSGAGRKAPGLGTKKRWRKVLGTCWIFIYIYIHMYMYMYVYVYVFVFVY